MKTIYKKLLILLLLLPAGILAQSTVSGVVLEKASGLPLPGVNVAVKGTTNGTATDFDGRYTLSNVKKGDVITFTFIGFADGSATFTGQSTINISLSESASELDEVVVQVGYGTVKKKDATGSVSTVSSKDFNKGSVVTAENLFNGKVAGVTVNTSGAPGSGSEIRIRGGASLSASNDPLIVIDGLPITNTTNTGSTSILAAINPNDIESFTVLKDASATAIYGSRASNGVIIITTKKGSKKLAVDVNFQYGSGQVVKTVDVFSAEKFRDLIFEQYPIDTGVPATDDTNAGVRAMLGTANTNWQEAIYRKTDFVDSNVSIRGSLFDIIPTRLSFGNTYQEGLRLTNSFNRNTLALNMNPSFFDNHLNISLNANYTKENNRFADGVEGSALRMDPTQPVYDPASPYGGFFEYYNPNNGQLKLGARNPVAQLLMTNDNGKNRRVYGNVMVDYKMHFLPEMKAVVNVGFDEARGIRTRFVPTNAASAPANSGVPYGTDEYSERVLKNKLFDFYLNYNKTINKFNIDATAGYSYQKFEDENYYTRNTRQPGYGVNVFPETDIANDRVLLGLFARTNFSFTDKYLLTLSYRRDGVSTFAKENRWANFPAVAFAWKIREDLFAGSQTVSDFKLRLGYGITGQQDVAQVYLQTYQNGDGVSQYVLGDSSYPIGVPNSYNPGIKWEETTTYNVGLDYGMFNNRISGALDFFYKQSDDLLSYAALPDGGNFGNAGFQNIGSFTTKGVEFSILAEVVRNDNFDWRLNFNASKFERRIDKLALGADIFTGGTGAGTGGTAQIIREGFTPYSFYVYKQLYDEDNRPIEGAYADRNGDGIINGDDRYLYKNADPDFTFGFASNMNYKNWDFSFNLRASVGNRVYNAVNSGRAQLDLLRDNAVLGNIPTQVMETGFATTSDVVLSDVYVENASFLRMDNITLGHTFPKWLDGNASVRLFAGVQNAFIITKYSGIDPEITSGIDNTIYPRQRSILFGANIKF
jgi:TonB-linked SusC/RagA family outer membrane protein